MKVTRIYTGPDNQSHFEDVEIPLKDGSVVGRLSELIPATGVIFRETGGDYDLDFHNAPRRQYVVMLEGEVEIETDGTTRPGHGRAGRRYHRPGTYQPGVNGKPRKSLFILLA